jgi:hypothetical protein
MTDGLSSSVDKMRAEGLGDAAVDTFRHYYERLRAGEQGVLAEADLEPVEQLPTSPTCPTATPATRSTRRSCSSSTAAWAPAWA